MKNNYIFVGEDYASTFQSPYLYERIECALFSIRYAADDKFVFDDSYQLHRYFRQHIKKENDLYQHRKWVLTLTRFLENSVKLIKDYDANGFIDSDDYYIDNSEYMPLHVWYIRMDELIQYLNHIVASFNYNYSYENEGRNILLRTFEVHHPDRIERISKYYNMDWDTYLDSIDL